MESFYFANFIENIITSFELWKITTDIFMMPDT